MAITMSLSVSPAGVEVEQVAKVTATISNSGAADVTVTLAELWVQAVDASDDSTLAVGGSESVTVGKLDAVIGRPGGTLTVPASGSLTLVAPVIIHCASSQPTEKACERAYAIDGRVWTSDGSVTDATAIYLVQLTYANENQRALLRFDMPDKAAYAAVGVL